MILAQIKEEAKKILQKSKSGCHDWEHTIRVYNLAEQIAQHENADLEIIQIAAILHDIGRPEQELSKGKVCHAEIGAKMALEILQKHPISPDKIKNIIHSIQCHRFKNNNVPQTIEAKIIYDADKLDAIGAVGIGRAFAFAGEHGAKLHNKDIVPDLKHCYTDEDTAYHEFLIKLSKIKDKLLTQEAKRIAQKRHQFMIDFFEQLNQEVEGIL